MPVASWSKGDADAVMRNVPAPKRAGELKYWWKEAAKVIPSMPKWENKGIVLTQDVDTETIVLAGSVNGKTWSLMIARKRNLK